MSRQAIMFACVAGTACGADAAFEFDGAFLVVERLADVDRCEPETSEVPPRAYVRFPRSGDAYAVNWCDHAGSCIGIDALVLDLVDDQLYGRKDTAIPADGDGETVCLLRVHERRVTAVGTDGALVESRIYLLTRPLDASCGESSAADAIERGTCSRSERITAMREQPR